MPLTTDNQQVKVCYLALQQCPEKHKVRTFRKSEAVMNITVIQLTRSWVLDPFQASSEFWFKITFLSSISSDFQQIQKTFSRGTESLCQSIIWNVQAFRKDYQPVCVINIRKDWALKGSFLAVCLNACSYKADTHTGIEASKSYKYLFYYPLIFLKSDTKELNKY